jgi:hypothetical protein
MAVLQVQITVGIEDNARHHGRYQVLQFVSE